MFDMEWCGPGRVPQLVPCARVAAGRSSAVAILVPGFSHEWPAQSAQSGPGAQGARCAGPTESEILQLLLASVIPEFSRCYLHAKLLKLRRIERAGDGGILLVRGGDSHEAARPTPL